jgi:peptide/nickel transport system substrate-binding protein
MATITKRVAVATLGAAIALSAVAACSSSGGDEKTPTSGSPTAPTSTAPTSSSTPAGKKGGTLYYTTGTRSAEHWDPQRMYIGRDLAIAAKLFMRNLTQLGPNNELLPDLATTTGEASTDLKTWSFTLRTDAKWEDGSTITCEDVKYGASRTYAQDIITGGPTYAFQFLDIPATPNDKAFATTYHGPYTKVGQADFDKAVSCAGDKITFKLKKPVGDFNYAVSTALGEFAAFKASQDKGDKSNFAVFSAGPYKLEGTWDVAKHGTFVRNDNFDPASDPAGLRAAFPDKIVFLPEMPTETVYDRLLKDAGEDKNLITDRNAPPAYLARAAAQAARFVNSNSPYNWYLTPNFKTLTNPKVREALAKSTDVEAYIAAEGGPSVAVPATGIVNPGLGESGGYKKFDPVRPVPADFEGAKALLKEAGVKIPYPIHYTYQGGTPTSDKTAAALKAGWEKAGFAVTLEGLSDTYYDVIQKPSNAEKYDVTQAGWGADWPSASTVIPPLFDSRVNLSSSSNGSDYGWYKNDATNAAMDAAFAEPDPAKAAADWAAIDESLAKEVAYIPLDITKNIRLYGSNVNYVDNDGTNGFPDLGAISLKS